MVRERDTQIIIEQKKAEDLQKDRKFLFEKQQAQSTELLTLQDEYANYKVPPLPTQKNNSAGVDSSWKRKLHFGHYERRMRR